MIGKAVMDRTHTMNAVQTRAQRSGWSRRYRAALLKHLGHGRKTNLQPAHKLGCDAVTLRLETLDLARIHGRILTSALLTKGSSINGEGQKMIERAKVFFAEAVVPIENTHRAAIKADARLNHLTRTLRRRTAASSSSSRSLKKNIRLRRDENQVLRKSDGRHARLLSELRHLQTQLRNLTHTRLSAQEDERQRMSFQLHDDISQALIAINLRLLTLKKAARASTASFKKEIVNTQDLVRESAKSIRQFTREFGIQHET